jgi:hypothetical protein
MAELFLSLALLNTSAVKATPPTANVTVNEAVRVSRVGNQRYETWLRGSRYSGRRVGPIRRLFGR